MATQHHRAKSWAPSSLRLRLPLFISALIAIVLAAFVCAAYREVKGTLREAGGALAQGAAEQLASLLSQSPQQRLGM